ncbi:unnamed protein product [Symbiodinium natans]|uniref:Uncharacterized protein n=1 Tax=Symbiodinium natans TaxID=878477 RepID=A0A812KFL4_9DINO|nr:unnamed protein product [Symbiodinium natans]
MPWMTATLGVAIILDHSEAAQSLLSELVESSKPHLRKDLQAFAHCFPDDYPFGYRKCCRDQYTPWFKEHMEEVCWDVVASITFQNCCVFKFGPELRGLPFPGHEVAPLAPAEFDLSVGRLRLRSSLDARPEEAVESFWPGGWIYAQLAADLPTAIQDCTGFGWVAGAQALQPLRGGSLRILDVSCGLGLSSIAAARAGHNVTATEVSLDLLRVAGRNAQRNRARLRLQRWDLLRAAPASSAHLPQLPLYDLCLVDIGFANERFRAAQLGLDVEGKPTVEAVLARTLRQLRQLGGCRLHAFIGSTIVHEAHGVHGIYEHGDVAFANFTAELLRGLAKLGAGMRQAVVSPLGWLERVGWTPPIWHHLILW